MPKKSQTPQPTSLRGPLLAMANVFDRRADAETDPEDLYQLRQSATMARRDAENQAYASIAIQPTMAMLYPGFDGPDSYSPKAVLQQELDRVRALDLTGEGPLAAQADRVSDLQQMVDQATEAGGYQRQGD